MSIGSTTTSTICFPFGICFGRIMTSAPGVEGSCLGVGSLVSCLGRTVLASSGSLNGVWEATLLGACTLSVFFPSAFLGRSVSFVSSLGSCLDTDTCLNSGAGFTLLGLRNGRPERKSSLDITESTSTSFPPTDKGDPGRRGSSQGILPISRPETSCRWAYPPLT